MPNQKLAAVTGAFGYLGSYIARRLLEKGFRVRTLTGHPNRDHALQGKIEVVPFHFDDPGKLVADLEGVDTFFNTYWVRFPHGPITQSSGAAGHERELAAHQEGAGQGLPGERQREAGGFTDGVQRAVAGDVAAHHRF